MKIATQQEEGLFFRKLVYKDMIAFHIFKSLGDSLAHKNFVFICFYRGDQNLEYILDQYKELLQDCFRLPDVTNCLHKIKKILEEEI